MSFERLFRVVVPGVSKRGLSLLLALALIGMALAFTAPGAMAAGVTKKSDAASIAKKMMQDQASNAHSVALDSPAVVRIITVVSGQVICQGCNSDGSNLTFPMSDDSLSAFPVPASGSGAFISPDGYILTADHVVDVLPNNPEYEQIFMEWAAYDISQHPSFGLTFNQALQALQQLQSQGKLQFNYGVTDREVFLSTAYTGQLQNSAQATGYKVTRVVASSPENQQDVAIIKIELPQGQDMPYLTLASASNIQVQDSVTAIAFPGDADIAADFSGTPSDFSALLNASQSNVNLVNSLLTPTVETGQVTAQKTLADGTPVYETNGIGSFGSSGGSVINAQGQIIGIVDRTGSNGTTRVMVAVPSEVISEYTRQADPNIPQGAFQSRWSKALNEYYATGPCHWTQAYQDLKVLRDDYAQFGGVSSFLRTAQTNATPAECPPPPKKASGLSSSSLLLFGGIGAGVLLLVVAGILLFVFLRRRQAAPTVAPVAGMGNGSMSASVVTPISNPLLAGPVTPVSNGMSSYNVGTSGSDPGYINSAVSPTPASGNMAYSNGMGTPGSNPALNGSVANPTPASGNMAYGMQGHSTPEQPAAPLRRCASGHIVSDMNARFCPECGALVESSAFQRQI